MSAGLTQWETCVKCGRRFLAVKKARQDYPEYNSCCPTCRIAEIRQVLRNTIGKWSRAGDTQK